MIGNVVDTDLFALKSNTEKPFKFLHISNLIALKNPDQIIAAAIKLHQEFNNFELHIGGDGDVEKLNELVKNNGAESFIKTFPILTLPEVAKKMSEPKADSKTGRNKFPTKCSLYFQTRNKCSTICCLYFQTRNRRPKYAKHTFRREINA